MRRHLFIRVITTLFRVVQVVVAKGDEHAPADGNVASILASAYRDMASVLRLPAVRSIAFVLFTCRAALGVFTSVTPLRLTEAGVPREKLALMSTSLFPVGITAQLFISGRYFAGVS